MAISKLKLENNMIDKERFIDDVESNMLDTADMIEKSVGNMNPVVVKL